MDNKRYMPIWRASLLIRILKQIISEKLWQRVVIQQLLFLYMLQTNKQTNKQTQDNLTQMLTEFQSN